MTISEELQKKFNAQHSAYERIMSSEIAGATDPESKKEAVLWVTIEAICGTIDGVLEAAWIQSSRGRVHEQDARAAGERLCKVRRLGLK